MKKGLWTVCLHPNQMDQSDIDNLEAFISAHREAFPDPRDAASRAVPYGPSDVIFGAAFFCALQMKRILAKRKA
jgi:hypothetical protein